MNPAQDLRRRYLKIVMIVAALVSVFPAGSDFVRAEPPECSVADSDSDGVHEISSQAELEAVTSTNCLDQDFIQTGNITIVDPWSPADEGPFTGTYLGEGFTITFDTEGEVSGVFPRTEGVEISGVRVDNESSTLSETGGWLVHVDGVPIDYDDPNAVKSFFSEIVTTGDIAGDDAGGIIGTWEDPGDGYTGMGYDYGSKGAWIQNSYTTGEIEGANAGGLVGYLAKGVVVLDSYSTGDITGANAGGLIGAESQDVIVSGSYTTGNIDGEFAGGIVGKMAAATTPFAFVTDSFTTGQIGGSEAGGIYGQDAERTAVFSSFTTGEILGEYAGGVVASEASGVTVNVAYSVGTIVGDRAGGIQGGWADSSVQDDTKQSEVLNSFSTGPILGASAGGIFGGNSDSASVSNSFSKGVIAGVGAGGLFGEDTEYSLANNSYSVGDITGANAGGLFGYYSFCGFTHSYTTGSLSGADAGEFYESSSTCDPSDGEHSDGSWSDEDASSTLVGVPLPPAALGATWGQCSPNTPYFLTVMHADDPCADVPDEAVEIAEADYGATPGDWTTGLGEFTLVNGFSSETRPTFISLVNDTGQVQLGGDDCEYLMSCRVVDFTGSGGFARATINATSEGEVKVMRLSISGNELDGWSYDIEQIGTLTIEEVESGGDGVVRRPRPLRTFNLDPAGGTCSGRTSVWNVSRRGSIPLPSATDCTKDGYVLLGWTRDPAKIAPEYLLHTTVSRGGPVIAVWGRLPSKPTVAFALPDFLCQGCGTALVAWQTPDTDTTGFVLMVDGRPTGCTAFAIGDWWLCAVQALTSGQPHTFEIAARNTNGAGPPITAI